METEKVKDNITFDNFQKKEKYDIAYYSGIGDRPSQQDCAYIAADETGVIAIMCDGMGGIAGGELASNVAVEAFLEYYQAYGASLSRTNKWMFEAVKKVDEIVFSLKDDLGNRIACGTTLMCMKIDGRMLSWVAVGDSRTYLFRGREMAQITIDHNYFLEIDKRKAEGTISLEEYEKEAETGDALISFIGMGGLMLIDISETPLELEKNDVIVMCTDGVYHSIPNALLNEIVMKSNSAAEKVSEICKVIASSAFCNQDNYTIAVIKVL